MFQEKSENTSTATVKQPEKTQKEKTKDASQTNSLATIDITQATTQEEQAIIMQNNLENDNSASISTDTIANYTPGKYQEHAVVAEPLQKKEDDSFKNTEDKPSPATHGVTHTKTKLLYDTKNGKTKKNKELDIPSDFVVSIIDDSHKDNLRVRVTINTDVYEGPLSRSVVNITPNSIGEINSNTKKDIVRVTSNGSGNDTKAIDVCYIHYDIEMSDNIKDIINSELDRHVSSYQSLSTPNKTISLPVDFAALSYETDLSEYDTENYLNKTIAYRFTRFNNGNTDDIILVEELGEYDKNETLSGENEKKALEVFENNDLGFINASKEVTQNELQTRIDAGDNKEEIIEMHNSSYFDLTDEDKNAIYSSILKLHQSALNEIIGLRFGRKSCKLEKQSNGSLTLDNPNAYYSSNDHEVILVSAGVVHQDNLFGDKGEVDFTDRVEFTILHEIGHAADYGPNRLDYKTDSNAITEKVKSINDQVTISNTAVRKYNKNKNASNKTKMNEQKTKLEELRVAYATYVKSLNNKEYIRKSGVGNKIIVNEEVVNKKTKFSINTSDIKIENDFKIALTQDAPYITEYSYNRGEVIYEKEAYAESFALYFSEPESLLALSPKVYAYFSNTYPK